MPKSLVEVLVDNVKAYMAEHNLSQTEMSRLGGIPQNTISRLLKADNAPTLDTLEALSKTLGVPLASLLKSDFDPRDYKPAEPPYFLARQVSRLVEDFMLCDPEKRKKILDMAHEYSAHSQEQAD